METYNIVLAKKFEKIGVFTCIRVYIQIKPHEKIEIFGFLKGGVYVDTCLHPKKLEI